MVNSEATVDFNAQIQSCPQWGQVNWPGGLCASVTACFFARASLMLSLWFDTNVFCFTPQGAPYSSILWALFKLLGRYSSVGDGGPDGVLETFQWPVLY